MCFRSGTVSLCLTGFTVCVGDIQRVVAQVNSGAAAQGIGGGIRWPRVRDRRRGAGELQAGMRVAGSNPTIFK